MFCIKTFVFILSDTMWPVSLPPVSTTDTFVGVTALLSGFGRTTQSKCFHTFNLKTQIKIVNLQSVPLGSN